MAFLLSPKTGGGAVSYTLVTNNPVSINGAPAQTYMHDSPATVHPGDVLTPEGRALMVVSYYDSLDEDASPIKDATADNSYTVEDVTGAIDMYVEVRPFS